VSILLLPIYVHGADLSSSTSFTRSDSLKRHRESLGKCQENQRANALRDLVPGANANEASTTSRAPLLPMFAQDVHITVQAQGSGQREASEASTINVVAYMDLKRFDRTDESGAADHVCFSLQGLKGLDRKPRTLPSHKFHPQLYLSF
jgi:hypothetical protein